MHARPASKKQLIEHTPGSSGDPTQSCFLFLYSAPSASAPSRLALFATLSASHIPGLKEPSERVYCHKSMCTEKREVERPEALILP